MSNYKQKLRQELLILSITDHPNIIKLYESYEDELYLHLVTELCTGGDVCERILRKGSFSEHEASRIMKQILGAINYLHSCRIIHRDLKPENFLYETIDSDDIKICDFGLSKIAEKNSRMKTVVGTPYYIAPEVLTRVYNKSCDIWSIGIFMYFMLIGKFPFRGGTMQSVINKSNKGLSDLHIEKIDKISDSAKDLIKKMLILQPEKRITLKEIMKHP